MYLFSMYSHHSLVSVEENVCIFLVMCNCLSNWACYTYQHVPCSCLQNLMNIAGKSCCPDYRALFLALFGALDHLGIHLLPQIIQAYICCALDHRGAQLLPQMIKRHFFQIFQTVKLLKLLINYQEQQYTHQNSVSSTTFVILCPFLSTIYSTPKHAKDS